jgi:hypothetical protein
MTTKTWNGANADWYTVADWSPTGVPGSSDDVVISSGDPFLQSGDAAVTVASIALGGTLALSGTATLTVGGGFANSGTIELDVNNGDGGGSLTIGGVLSNSGNVEIDSGTPDAAATVTLGGLTNNSSSASFQVLGSASHPATLVFSGGGAGFTSNAGTFALSEAAALTLVSALTNAGTFELLQTAPVTLDNNLTTSGTVLLTGTSALTVSGNVGNSGNLDLDVSASEGGGSLTIGGTLANTGTVQIGPTSFSLSAATVVTLGGLTNASGAGFEVFGSASHSATLAFNSGGSGFTSNAGGVDLWYAAPLTLAGAFSNSGTFQLNGTSALTVGGGFANSGTIELDVNNGDGGGSLTVGGTLANSKTVQVGNGGNTLSAATPVTLGGLTNASGASFQIFGSVSHAATLSVMAASSNAGILSLQENVSFSTDSGVGLNNSGTLDIDTGSGDGGSTVSIGGVLTNSGTIQIGPSDGSLSANITVTAGGLVNTGSISLYGGSATKQATLTINGASSNSGSINIGAFASFIVTGPFNQTSGTTILPANATLTNVTLTGGALRGSGTILVMLHNVGGTVEADPTPTTLGTLTVNGTYIQGLSGILQADLTTGGAALVNIINNNNVTLAGGTLVANAESALTPDVSYTVMSFVGGLLRGMFSVLQEGASTGNGTNVNLGNGMTLETFYNNAAGNIQVELVTTPTVTSFHWVDATGSWDTASDWGTNAVPTATSNVTVGDTTSGNVTLSHDATVNSLTINSQNTLSSTATLTVGANITVQAGGTLNLNEVNVGGSFTVSGTVAVTGILTPLGVVVLDGGEIFGGTLAGSGLIETPSGENGELANVTISAGTSVIAAAGSTAKLIGITGAGQLQIGAGSMVEVGGATSVATTFLGANNASLLLDAPAMFSGAVTNFFPSDTIDFAGISANGADYANGVLTLEQGSTPVAELTLSFGAGTVGVRLRPDGSGGTDVTALSQIVPADFNGDGYGSVLFRNELTGQLSYAAIIAGNFAGIDAATAGVGGYLYGGDGDVNGDGYADVVVQDPKSGTIYVALEHGNGTPSWIVTPPVPGWHVMGVGEIAGDGFADIVIQNQTSGAIDYYDVHDGTFTAVAPSTASQVVGVGDVNGLGYDDIVLQNAATGEIDYLNMLGGVNNGLLPVVATPGYDVRAVGDLTSDGYADIVIQSETTGQTLFANMQGGQFSGWGQATSSLTPDYVVTDAVDVLGNGHADVIVQQQSTGVTYYAEEGANGFVGWGDVTGTLGPEQLAVGDKLGLSHDAALASDYTGSGTGDVLFRNDTSGQLQFAEMSAGVATGFGSATGNLDSFLYVGHGDVNGDGYADVVVQDPSSRTIYVALQNGSGTPSYIATPPVPGWQGVGVGDIAGDGFADIVIQNQGTGAIDYYDAHSGAFTTVAGSTASQVVGVGDVNGQGNDDIVLQNAATGEIDYLDMTGGVNNGLVPVATTPGWQVRAVGDLTGNGYADIVVQNGTTGQTAFANMQGGVFNGWGEATTPLSPDYLISDAVDVFNNGHADLIVQQQSTGATTYAEEGSNGFLQFGVVANLGPGWQAV